MSMLEINDIHVFYGAIHAIKGVSFEVREHEIVTLIGANGAGKSTILNTVAGLLKPRSGQVLFEGKNINSVPASKMVGLGMALCPEGRRIFQQMTVRENLEMGGYSRPAAEITPSIENVFQRFPRLKERERQIAGTLSGGEQQMLAMARALMSRFLTSFVNCTRREPQSCWWSRTLRWRCPLRTGPTCWKPETSP